MTRPGGRIGVVVRAVDMPFWVNLPLDPALKAKVDAPNVIGGGVAPKGVSDASPYQRLAPLGLTGLKCFPQFLAVVPGSERIRRYEQQMLATDVSRGRGGIRPWRRRSPRAPSSSPCPTTAPSQPKPG